MIFKKQKRFNIKATILINKKTKNYQNNSAIYFHKKIKVLETKNFNNKFKINQKNQNMNNKVNHNYNKFK